MPKIHLKPNSPEFADEDEKPQDTPICEMPGCAQEGIHRAPKDRSLSEYYNFCFEHVSDYNRAWDYFSGMSSMEIEDHIINSFLGDRPTWKYTTYTDLEEHLIRKAWQAYKNTDQFDEKSQDQYEEFMSGRNSGSSQSFDQDAHGPQAQEVEAMAIMGLEPPLTLDAIKTRYKELAKKYHPDLNPDNKNAEELLKSINMAYTILKLSYSKYKSMTDKD